jgi:hypothetical protein
MNASKDFSRATIKALAVKGIRVIGAQAAPAFDGDKYFSGVLYSLDDNGTCRMRRFNEVIELAK